MSIVSTDVSVKAADIDSLWILPLAVLPLKTPGLRKVRLMKSNHLEGVVEMFASDGAGSGHIRPLDLSETFADIDTGDTAMIEKLAALHSYDVYSLRISLREMGVDVTDSKHLTLSKSKQEELAVYMKPFTDRLIMQIYGDDGTASGETDIQALFRDADPNVARQKLKTISDTLNIDLQSVPQFLEDYGDIYLSIAYYRQNLISIAPVIMDFLEACYEISRHNQLSQNPEAMKVCKRLEAKTAKLRDVLSDRFAVFQQSTEAMWEDMNAERFGEFKQLVEDNHAALGGLLCTLSVKMNGWHKRFPERKSAGPHQWVDYMMTDTRQGY
ncbi:MAG: hypothetical protein HOI45_15710 [Rhodospirillaceae bacterium]|nr:hypothetical protein [Rhodospirillaceae bacterium]